MFIKSIFSFIGFLLLGLSLPVIASNNLWQDIKPVQARAGNIEPQQELYQKARFLKLNRINMAFALDAMARENLSSRFASVNSSQNIALPLPDGEMIEVELVYENLMENALKQKFPQLKTYRILPGKTIVSGSADMTAQGFHAMLLLSSGKTVFIDPLSAPFSGSSDSASLMKKQSKQNDLYVSYYKKDQKQSSSKGASCGVKPQEEAEILETVNLQGKPEILPEVLGHSASGSKNLSQGMINYRIAIAATGEYTARQGGTVIGAMSAIVTTLNRINQIYARELGIHLSLVANNDALIYTDAAYDPYYENNKNKLLKQNQENLDAVIGSQNYDIGHLFTTSGGGLAKIASLCNNSKKGQGISGINNPVNDSFDLDFVAHEIGHQFGATHTFNGNHGLCAGSTRTSITAFEPGSGSSLMSYAGYCGVDNLQSNSDAMFHIASIRQIRKLALSRGESCGIHLQSYNRPPAVYAGKDYVIPARTPFELHGSALDPESDSLVYSWQQVDSGKASPVNRDNGDNPLFRLYMPTDTAVRSFPAVNSLVTHQFARGEKLPETERELHFSLVAEDGKNAAQSDEMMIRVYPTGSRFSLFLPHSQYNRGDTHKVLWNVAGTNQSPINCTSVDIFLSLDSGFHFPVTLARNLPNTGLAWVTIPATLEASPYGRFKVKCSDNIFFAISYRDFAIAEQGSVATVLADQDQPEPDSGKPQISGGGNGNQSAKAGGVGVIEWFILFSLFLLIRRKRISQAAFSQQAHHFRAGFYRAGS